MNKELIQALADSVPYLVKQVLVLENYSDFDLSNLNAILTRLLREVDKK